MKMVEFTRDMRPQRAGERRVLPDDVAARLIGNGEAIGVASVFDQVGPAAAPSAPPEADQGRNPHNYRTRGHRR